MPACADHDNIVFPLGFGAMPCPSPVFIVTQPVADQAEDRVAITHGLLASMMAHPVWCDGCSTSKAGRTR
ncbi:hypothetical protein BN940_07891 [Castellaniella defragrans 65Phen]|uniref:Uncharacterized protein n=1 Tax=Castellaniella defragrans (strain DSM 12143 / CCUG 39792 / 65Phen) TaxID=1437824 RepID=W8X3Y0_CASD6|nr:hypothetical protein BN940_07891 [Castellaniella defragrans 65Phen]